jgi:hypothetical protein
LIRLTRFKALPFRPKYPKFEITKLTNPDIRRKKTPMPKKPSHQPSSHSRRNHFHYTRIKEPGLCACEGGSAYSLIVEAMATTGGGPLLALLCATEGDGDALWDGRHALNAMAARAHLTSLLPAAARSR